MSWSIAARTCYACLTCQPKQPASSPPSAVAAASPAAQAPKSSKKVSSIVKVEAAAEEEDAADGKRRRLSSGVLSKNLPKKENETSTPAPSVVFNSHCAREPLEARIAQGASKLNVKEIKEQLQLRGLPASGRRAELASRLDSAMYDEPEGCGVGGGGGGELPMETDALAAAGEKALAGEGQNVEHIAELAPSQVRRARAAAGAAAVKKKQLGQKTKTAKRKAQPTARRESRRQKEAIAAPVQEAGADQDIVMVGVSTAQDREALAKRLVVDLSSP
jgi:hypothetical protein